MVTEISQPETAVAKKSTAAFLAGITGWTLDAFDFFLVVFCLTAIGRDFHKSDAAVSLSIVVTLAFRPLGGFIFGLLADRYGRRGPLVVNLLICSVVQALSGIAPTFGLFLASRAVFGMVMGGQWGVGASLAMESVPARLRGLLSGMLQQGYAAGYLLAALCYYLLFERVGWRPLFFLASLPALLTALFVALRVEESAVWKQTRHESWNSLGKGLLSHWKLLLYITLLTMTLHMTSHGSQDMYPTFLERQWGFRPSQRALLTACSMVGAILGGTLCGFLSDRFGRRRAMITALAGALLAIPLWAFSPSVPLLVLGAFLMQFMVQGAWGSGPGALDGTIAGFGARIPARLRQSMWRGVGKFGGIHRSSLCETNQLRHRHGGNCQCCGRLRHTCDRPWAGTAGDRVRHLEGLGILNSK